MAADLLSNGTLTPTLKRFLELLLDGLPHRRNEFRKLCNDDMVADEAINEHIRRLRPHLAPHGLLIVCNYSRPATYQLVRRHTPGE